MGSPSKKKKKSGLEKELEVQQKALKKIIRALEERDPLRDEEERQPSKPNKK